MEGRKQVGNDGSGSSSSSSSSFTSELFGSQDLSSSSGIFGAIFEPNSSKVVRRESVHPESNHEKHDSTTEAWKTKPEGPDDSCKAKDGRESQSTLSMDSSSIYQDQRVEPCHLSSSIYYGGQDVYSQPQNSPNSGFNSTKFKKDGGGEDDSESASRGNWWQGLMTFWLSNVRLIALTLYALYSLPRVSIFLL